VPNDVQRCEWVPLDQPQYLAYHDEEWGVPSHDDRHLFEMLVLEGAQAGLSWSTILNKREAFREVFAGFDADTVAGYDEADVARLMDEPRIVRNRRKIDAAILNARATVALREAGGLPAFVDSFAPEQPPAPTTSEEMVATSPGSVALSKALKKRGFAFVGPTTMHALMEAIGIFDPHLVGCHRRSDAPVT
jgi:DNA-3-methyladenine glycosylase I